MWLAVLGTIAIVLATIALGLLVRRKVGVTEFPDGSGRVGFDADAHDAAIDAAADAASGAQCSARHIAGFDYGLTGATDLAAAQTANGYAIGALFTASTLWGVALDASLAPNAS